MVVIYGAGESGVGAALLAQSKGLPCIIVNDKTISQKFRTEIEKNKIQYQEKVRDFSFLRSGDEIIKSPGISPKTPFLEYAKNLGVEVITEIEFAGRYLEGKVVGITGTNGKTTTVEMIATILEQCGQKVTRAGNIGVSLSRILSKSQYDYYILEMSSFQLLQTEHISLDIAVFLNFSPDHLDWHKNLEEYFTAKTKILEFVRGDINGFIYDFSLQTKLQKYLPNGINQYSVSIEEPEADLFFNQKSGRVFDEVLPPGSLNHLFGKQNCFNALVALGCVRLFGFSLAEALEGLTFFKPVEHRLEPVRTWNGIKFVNDSKATNVDAVRVALESLEKNVLLLLGGRDKNNDYSVIVPLVKEKGLKIIAFGESRETIRKYFGKKQAEACETLEKALEKAIILAKAESTIILSPACSSYDQYESYIERGNEFKKLVNEL